MCLGIPGKIESMDQDSSGVVNFGGLTKKINLAFVPESVVGDYVIVHAGFGISRIDEHEAQRVFQYLEEIGELEELQSTTHP